MYESFRSRPCVSRCMDRKQSLGIVRNTLLSLMSCLCLGCASRQDAGAPCPVIEMSVVADRQSDSTRTIPLNDTTTILVSRRPLVTTGDITGAIASPGEDQWAVNFTVTDEAAARVHAFSTQHVGSNMALVADGKIHGTPRISGAIAGNRYRMEGFSRADAERLAASISNGCRR